MAQDYASAAVFNPTTPVESHPGSVRLAVVVAALGYFVDIYDLSLFSVVRVQSLKDLGVAPADLFSSGVLLINAQMAGLVLGGFLWGILGDKRGRLSVLFGSILVYSCANILNGLVTSVGAYAALRLLAGVGLAGELGAGVTLVSELMRRESRSHGTTIIAGVGLLGAVVAALVGDLADWRVAYFIGGGLGLGLLLLRVGVRESGLFASMKARLVSRGDLRLLLSTGERRRRFASVILVAVPIWFVTGVLVTFAPEFARALRMAELPTAGTAVMFDYIGLALGDVTSGALSHVLRSRRRVIGGFLTLTILSVLAYFFVAGRSPAAFYAVCLALGFSTGYWAVFMMSAAEAFGTNVRATATTLAPNLVRGTVVPMTAAFAALRGALGLLQAAACVAVAAFGLAFIALALLPEGFGRDLDFHED